MREAREECRTFDDFKERLAERGVGVTTTKDGENMFYQARHGEDGKLLAIWSGRRWQPGLGRGGQDPQGALRR